MVLRKTYIILLALKNFTCMLQRIATYPGTQIAVFVTTTVDLLLLAIAYRKLSAMQVGHRVFPPTTGVHTR